MPECCHKKLHKWYMPADFDIFDIKVIMGKVVEFKQKRFRFCDYLASKYTQAPPSHIIIPIAHPAAVFLTLLWWW